MHYERKKYKRQIINAIKKVPIVIIIGARQVGKTTLLNNLNIKRDTVFLHGQDPEQYELFSKISIIQNWLSINLNKNLDGFVYIDEFQYIPDISTKLKILTDNNPKLKIICTGSSSLNILQNVKESLAGRFRIIEVFSLSIEEDFLFHNKRLLDAYGSFTIDSDITPFRKEILSRINNYLIFGGFPRQSQEEDPNEKIEMINDIYRAYLQRDVRQFVINEDFIGFNKLLKFIALQIGNLVNINELSQKSGLSYKKTEEYLDLLEQMYIIKMLKPYYTNKRKVLTKMKKVYFTDLGMRNIIVNDFRNLDNRHDAGALFENFVLLELLKYAKNTDTFYYYRTIDGSEIDFVIETSTKKIIVESKFNSFKNGKNFRNIEAFTKFENPDEIYVINQDANIRHNKYHFIPAVLSGKIMAKEYSGL